MNANLPAPSTVFFQIWIKFGTGDIHKQSLYYPEFREHWISENHILLKGYKFHCLPAIFIFRAG